MSGSFSDMVLDKQRHRLDWWLVPLAKALRSIHPNVFTWWSLVAAFAGGYAFYRSSAEEPLWLVVAWAMVLLNSVLDLLDGKVATMTGKTSLKGDYLDHAIDRFSDVLFIGGIALSSWVSAEVGLLAVAFTLLTSYLGTQAQAVGIGRNYGGLLGRADRMVMMLVVPLVTYFLVTRLDFTDFNLFGWSFTLPGWMLVYFAAVGLVTTIQRFVGGLRAFNKDGGITR